MLNWLFGYKADSQTKVQIWRFDSFPITEESAKGNLTLIDECTWDRCEYKKYIELDHNFTSEDTLSIIFIHHNFELVCFNSMDQKSFKAISANIPIRNSEERDAWIQRMIDALPAYKEHLEKLSKDISGIQQSLKEIRNNLERLRKTL